MDPGTDHYTCFWFGTQKLTLNRSFTFHFVCAGSQFSEALATRAKAQTIH
jgi:hypothetical protein